MLNGTIKDKAKLRGRCSTLKFKFIDKIMTEARWPGVYCENVLCLHSETKDSFMLNVRHMFRYGRSPLSVLLSEFLKASEQDQQNCTSLVVARSQSWSVTELTVQ